MREHPATDDLQRSLGCSRLAARLLAQRGFTTESAARTFLSPDFEGLPDPWLLPDASPAVRRLMRALDHGERIYVHGDYDGDGITATALWARLLDRLGGDVMAHVPHRRNDGYDLRSKFVETAHKAGAKLIVTADCGIQRLQEVADAAAAGIDVIVTDHHEVGKDLPRAVAVVNPHRTDSRYPFRDLAGVGVSFRLGEALVKAVGLPVAKYRAAFCDLAAIGTITDIMPLLEDNRVFVHAGLTALAKTRRRGLRALLSATRLGSDRPISSQDVGYVIGPRLNAVGRMDDPRKAFDLLVTQDDEEAKALAGELERANLSRREEEQRILEEAVAQIGALDLERQSCIVLDAPNWHAGVIGIVANRIAERYCRPTVLVATDRDTGLGRGSARSIPALNLHDALAECSEHFVEFGGHAHAAGFTIPNEQIEPFRHALYAITAERLCAEDLEPVLVADAELPLQEVNSDLLDELAHFEPWGHDNEEPLFMALDVGVEEARRIGRDRSHLKMWLKGADSDPVDAVMWHGGSWTDLLQRGSRVDVLFRARLNRYNGRERPQMQVEDLRPATHSGAERSPA